MPRNMTFTTKIEADHGNPWRYRWKVFQELRQRDISVYSFATKREAQIDADEFVAKLNSTWRT